MANSANASKKYNFSREICYRTSIKATENLGWLITQNLENNLNAQVPMTMNSWGELISIRINDDGHIFVVSQCSKSQIVDWGKNKKNISIFFDEVDKLIGIVANEYKKNERSALQKTNTIELESDKLIQLEKLAELKAKSIISAEEFEIKKMELLGLIKCPECGKSISDKAEKCNQCGFPFVNCNSSKSEYEELGNKVKAKQESGKRSTNGTTLTFIIIGLVIIIAGIYYLSKNSESESENVKNSKPDYTLDAKEFNREFNSNLAAANQKYEGKVIEINGQILEIGGDFIYLFGTVMCKFNDDQLTTLIKIKESRRITIKGVYPKYQGIVPKLNNCVIVEYFDF